mmetsp:Transcript_34460/g.72558  ORF Transcript_34460/g.72558 Transcript_34460/m.72558 type:complete len:435 (+) Transcript_34460:93-1397(+)
MLAYLSQAGPLHPKHGGGGGDRIISSSGNDRLATKTKESPPRLHQDHQDHESSSSQFLPPSHPSLTFLLHYAITIPSIFYIHDSVFLSNFEDHPHVSAATASSASAVVPQNDDEFTIRSQTLISQFLFAYTIILFSTRYFSSYKAGRLRHHSVLYELTWLCNSTLLMGALSFGGLSSSSSSSSYNNADDGNNSTNSTTAETIGGILSWLFRRRPLVATACCIAVSIDQVLWYVDLLGWIFSGKFLIGVMKYLTWEQTLWIDRFTCTHHLWTIPVMIYGGSMSAMSTCDDDDGCDVLLGWDSFGLSVYVVFIHVLLSRWLTPHCIQSKTPKITNNHHDGDKGKKKKDDPQQYRYLNVNLSHELWRDISFSFLQISIDNPPCWVYLFRLLWRWQLFNGMVFVAILRPLSRWMAGLHAILRAAGDLSELLHHSNDMI